MPKGGGARAEQEAVVEVDRYRTALFHRQALEKKKASQAKLGDAARGSFGALATLLAELEPEHLKAKEQFHEHTPFLCGEALVQLPWPRPVQLPWPSRQRTCC